MPPRRSILLGAFAALSLPACGVASAAAADELYRSQAIVTGTGEVNRRLGLAQCLEDVLVKVSGDPRLIGDPRAAALARRAATLVKAFRYRDRLAHRPINDEQGTRDRPHDLTVDFDPAKIDAALRSLERAPWTGPRPRIVVFLGVQNGPARYVLASDGERGVDQREALAAAARQVAMPMTLPSRAALAAAGLRYENLTAADPSRLNGAARSSGGELALAGRLVWSDQALGWIAEWRLMAKGAAYRWQIRGVSFDDAFRNAMRGAAQILSGNGRPQ